MEEIDYDYYSTLPTAPPPQFPAAGNAGQQQGNLSSDGKPSLLTASIKGDLGSDYQAGGASPDALSPPTSIAQYSLLSRSSLSQSSSSSDLGTSVGSFGKSYSRTITSKSPSRAINIGSSGFSTPMSYSISSVSSSSARILNQSSLAHESTLDLYESSSFSSSPLSASVSYKTYLNAAAAAAAVSPSNGSGSGSGSGSNIPSQLGSPTPPGAVLPVLPPELPAASGVAESPSSQGEALVVVELDKEREAKEKTTKLGMSRRGESERNDGLRKVSDTPKKDSGLKLKASLSTPFPSPKVDKRKHKTLAVPVKSLSQDDKTLAGTPVASNFDFKALLDRPDFKHIKTTIDAFVKGFEKKTKGDVDEEVKNTRLLIKATENSLKHHQIWSKLPHSHTVVANEEMQRYIYSRLYNVYRLPPPTFTLSFIRNIRYYHSPPFF